MASTGAVGAAAGSDPKYKSTQKMAFRGQDKPPAGALGAEPNIKPEDDYVALL